MNDKKEERSAMKNEMRTHQGKLTFWSQIDTVNRSQLDLGQQKPKSCSQPVV